MAFTLAYTVTESNDNKTITITDASGTGATGWGAGTNPATTDIGAVGSTHDLQLIISITTSSNTTTTYTAIDLYTEFGPFATVADLVFPITCDMLVASGTALGTSADEFPDGIYNIKYVYNLGETNESTVDEDVLIDGVITVEIYDLLRQIPTIYNCSDCKSKTVLDAIYCYGCLNVMESDAYVARSEEIINLLYVLERLVEDGSTYSW